MSAPRPYIPEAVDPEAVSPSAPFRAIKQFGLVLLCAAWVALGLAGHDPWKTEDATSIGVAVEMAQRNDFVVPTLGGEPYLPRPPLAYMGGALSINALSPPLTAHNAARVIVGLALALVLLATAFASRELNGRAFRWLPVLILVGSVGFWDRAHVLSPELFLTLGIAVGLWGIALALRRPVLGRRRARRGHRDRVHGQRLHGPAVARSHGARAAAVRHRMAQPRVRRDRRHRAACRRSCCRCPGRSRCTRAIPRSSRNGWRASRPRDYLAFLGDAKAEPLYYLRNLAWFAWPALPLLLWLAVAARARLQRRPARSRHRGPGRAWRS